jgi:hypothetical protein
MDEIDPESLFGDKKLQEISKNNIVLDNDRDITLTENQKEAVLKAWHMDSANPPSIKQLVDTLYPHMGLDGRSKQGKAIKEFLSTFSLAPKTTAPPERQPDYQLNHAETEFIRNNFVSMKTMEMAKHLWGPQATPLDRESRALVNFLKELNYRPEDNENQVEENGDMFVPPKTYTKCLNLVNQYAYNVIDFHNASEKEKRGVETLIRYLHSPRFVHTINSYQSKRHHELFLSEFIRTTYDKPDLTADELNLYINLCCDYVLGIMIQREIEMLSETMREILEDPDKKRNLTDGFSKTISAKTQEYNDCLKRQKDLVKELNGTRSARLNKQANMNHSVLSLVEYWREEKKRQKMVHVASMKKQLVGEEINKLLSVDSIRCEIFGAVANPDMI